MSMRRQSIRLDDLSQAQRGCYQSLDLKRRNYAKAVQQILKQQVATPEEHPVRGAQQRTTTLTINVPSEAQFINQLIATRVPVNIYISNGVKLTGQIHFYSPTDHVIWLRPQAGHRDDLSMVFLNCVSTISSVGSRYLNRRAARELDGVL
jgi:sRNA-binding regulator protein Hfq